MEAVRHAIAMPAASIIINLEPTTHFMEIKKALAIVFSIGALLCSCDDTTDNIGKSLVDDMDNLKATSKVFAVKTSSQLADSVYSRSTTGYLGRIKDPETGGYVKGDFVTQFYTLEGTQFPDEESIKSRLGDGSIIADSCVVYLYYDEYYGDSLTTMKLNALEMSKAMNEGDKYYSNFNPETQGYVRTDGKGVSVSKSYTLYDMAADTVPKRLKIKMPNSPLSADSIATSYAYTSADGKQYYNYGTYLMQKYYENPKLYKNAYTFINNVCPGFFFKVKTGLGSMAEVNMSQMLVYYKYQYKNDNGNDTIASVVTTFAGTEEVLQTTTISNDDNVMEQLASDNTCTYVKSPAGIFTTAELPVDDIMLGHENDTINSARLTFTRINNEVHDKYSFDIPSTLLLVPQDSLYAFFENAEIADYKTSYLASFSTNDATYSSSTLLENTYSFHNIANLITEMYREKTAVTGEQPADSTSSEWAAWKVKSNAYEAAHPNWNKVVVVPVTTTYNTVSSSSQLVKVENDMSLTSTRLLRGDGQDTGKVKITVVYSNTDK